METIKIIFYAVMIIIFFVLPIITLLIRLYQKPFKRYSRGVPEPPKKLRDRYNEKYANPSLSKSKNSSYWEERENTRTENPNDSIDAITMGLMMNSNTEEMINNSNDDHNKILEASGIDKGFDGGFGGGGFSGSGAGSSWSDDNSSSHSSSYDSGSSSSSDSSSYDSGSSSSE